MISLPIVRPVTAACRGRFAPTPSGPLHLGSLFTALASWLVARQAGGEWWLRVDDLDTPRCVPGAEDTILRQLEAHGLVWDGAPVRQSAHEAEYREALETLRARGRLYACTCTRATLAATALEGPDGPVYAGTCRSQAPVPDAPHALRFKGKEGWLQWPDGIQGLVRRECANEIGDFTVRRSDGQIGYHLACALDEARMGITEVVRGADLIGATAQQIQLMQALHLPQPRYAHVPVLVAADGRKLSKQNGATALGSNAHSVARQLAFCLRSLGLVLPAGLNEADGATLLQFAVVHWRLDALPARTTLPAAAAPQA